MREEDVFLVLSFTAFPLVVIAAGVLVGWLYRRSLQRAMLQRTTMPFDNAHPSPAHDLAAPHPSPISDAELLREAKTANRITTGAYWAAWLVYAVVVSAAFATYSTSQFFLDVRIAILYALLVPQLLIVLWAIRTRLRWRFLFIVLYVALGLAALFATTRVPRAMIMLHNVPMFAIVPIPGLLLLFIRRIQAFLLFLIAFVTVFFGFAFVLNQFRYATTDGDVTTLTDHPLLVLLGLCNFFIAALITYFLLRQRWQLRVVPLLLAVIAVVLLDRDMTQHNLSPVVRAICFVGVPILLLFGFWSLFRLFVWLQDRRLLTNELFQQHICWALLTIFYIGTSLAPKLYRDQLTVRTLFALAFVLHVVVLHALLFLIRRQRRALPHRRLLFLRVFGRTFAHERLIDRLNDTWRRIGAIDLIASTDVVSRTLGSRILAAFLLRRTDEQFLQTETDVETRVRNKRTKIEGDVRYPLDALYCRPHIWQLTVQRFAATSDAVLMDVRGFTSTHQGAKWELDHVLTNVAHRHIVLLTEQHDVPELNQILRDANITDAVTILKPDRMNELFGSLLHASAP